MGTIPVLHRPPTPRIAITHAQADPLLQRPPTRSRRRDRRPRRLGEHLSGPFEVPGLHRPPRPARPDPGGVRFRRRPRRGGRGRAGPSTRGRDRGEGCRPGPGRRRQPEARHGRDRTAGGGARDPEQGRDPPDPPRRRRGGEDERGDPPSEPLPRPAATEDAADPRDSFAGRAVHPFVLPRPGLPRDRDPPADQVDPGGRPRLRRPQPTRGRFVVRPAPEPAALQADPDDRGLRAVHPTAEVPSRRGSPGRPPGRVHADRSRDELRGP